MKTYNWLWPKSTESEQSRHTGQSGVKKELAREDPFVLWCLMSSAIIFLLLAVTQTKLFHLQGTEIAAALALLLLGEGLYQKLNGQFVSTPTAILICTILANIGLATFNSEPVTTLLLILYAGAYLYLNPIQAFKVSVLAVGLTGISWSVINTPDVHQAIHFLLEALPPVLMIHVFACLRLKTLSQSQSEAIQLKATLAQLQHEQGQLNFRHQELEEINNKANTMLAEMGKVIHAQTQFIRNASQSIKGPLTVVAGLSNTLGTHQGETQARRFIEDIQRTGHQLLELVSDVMDYSKLQAGEIRPDYGPVDLLEIKNELLSSYSPTALNKKLHFYIRIDPNCPDVVSSDKSRILQVLDNLLSNAFKHTSQGEVRVDIKPVNNSPQGGEGILFRVSDTGCGIAESSLGGVFKPFAVEEEMPNEGISNSRGIGLALCKSISTLLNGTLRVTSQVNKGSSFELCLPLKNCEACEEPCSEFESLNQSFTPEQSASRQLIGKSVLLVDDHILNAHINSHIFESKGLNVLVAPSGFKAVELVDQSIREQKPFDLILMDVQMPGMSGLEASAKIRGLYQSTGDCPPILALTAGVSPEELDQIAKAKLEGVIPKPFDIPNTIALMAMALQKRRSNQESN